MKFAYVLLLPALCIFLPEIAHASEKFALQSDVDHVWTMTAAGLVFFMQAGFMLLEAGTVRAKNSVNVAQKNLIDFLLSTVCFGAIGFAVMFGTTQSGWFGWSSDIAFFSTSEDWSMTFFVFQLVFCGTAATIVSGAVAERMAMPGYILCTILIALLIYPVVGHWAWGGLLNGQDGPWLQDMGFMDFAGGTVVHSVGAWVGLAIIILIGARRGRFDEDGTPITLHGHSPILATVGAIIIWVGWIGFNGGSTTAGTGDFAKIVQNTMICGGLGGATALFVGWALCGHMTPSSSINGVLAGLVAITPGCDVLDGTSSMWLGIMAGILVIASETVFEKIGLDDPLGAVSVHGVCGAFGTVMLAVFAPVDSLLVDTRSAQIWVQLIGVVAVFVWSFGVAFAVLGTISLIFRPGGGRSWLRVPADHELIGLNVSEHNAPLGTGILQSALHDIAMSSDKDFQRIDIERGDEAYEMAELINKIMGELHGALTEMEQSVQAASHGDFAHRIDLEQFSGTPRRLCEGMNKINESCENGLLTIQDRLDRMAGGDLASDISTTLQGQFGDLRGTLMAATGRLSSTLTTIATSADRANEGGQRIVHANNQLTEVSKAQQAKLAHTTPILADVQTASNEDTDRARQSADICANALSQAETGLTIARKTLSGVDSLDQAVAEINLAVDQIEDIARQINLLAVNAGVEAARVGTLGGGNNASKGFKIVAEEVRTLADNTHETLEKVRAKSNLVSDTTFNSRKLVLELQSSLTGVYQSIKDSSELSQQVADAGAIQLDRLQDVVAAIEELKNSSDQTDLIIQSSKCEATALAQDAELTVQKLTSFAVQKPDDTLNSAA